MQALISFAAVVLVLGVLVFVHEFGHYAVAKLCGVRVEVFSLGFGKRLWGFRRGTTDYRISLLPLGGYVKMAGENPLEERTGDPGEFASHPRWQRFLIAIAGPAMNIILAIVVLAVIYMVHFEYPTYWKKTTPVAWVEPNAPAAAAGILPGDRIIKIDNVSNPTWEQITYRIALNPNQHVDVALQRGNQVVNTVLTPKAQGPDQSGYAGVVPEGPTLVRSLEEKTPAERAGLQHGDQLLAVNGTPILAVPQFSDLVQQIRNSPMDLTVLRNGKQINFHLVPELLKDDLGTEKWRIGANLMDGMEVGKLPPGPAFARSLDECKTNSLLIFELVGKMLQHKVSIKQMSGPIVITKLSGEAAKEGLLPLMGLMALISLNLAIFNLLPIPILDGGLILMLAIEGAMRRDIKQEIKERVYQVAFVFLLVFAAVVIYNDLAKTLPGHLL